MIGQFSKSRLTPLFHDLTGRHGNQLQRDLLIEVVGGGLQDERGAVRRDDGVVGGRRRGGGDAGFFILVSLYVLGQVVAPHEPLGALYAHKLLLPCVCPPVSLQLVAPGEPLPTEHPVADEGSLSAVPAQVSSEMRRLPVNLPAAHDVADMLLLLPHARPSVKGRKDV